MGALTLVPSPTVSGFNIAAPGANANILTSALVPKKAGWFSGSVVLAVSSVVNYTVTSSATTFTVGLNNSQAVAAGDELPFAFPVHPDFSYNFQIETNGIVQQLVVVESDEPPGMPANQGTVSVGAVSISSVTPGTGASALGKAEDAPHASGDVGVLALAVRKDSAGALAGTDGDYVPLICDEHGRLHVTAAPATMASNLSGQVTVASTGVAVQFPSQGAGNFFVKAHPDNTDTVWVGNDGAGDVASSNGYPLNPGEQVVFDLENLKQLFADADVSGEKVCWIKTA